jgi:DNA-binding PadR family transcriptional regulator
MSIRNGLLALLEQQPMYGYQLRSAFEQCTGSTWPLNIGQVYSTLARLERDGMIAATDGQTEGQRTYAITERGRSELQSWFASPVARDEPPRDELAIKLALALVTPGVDVADVVQRQRSATVAALQGYTRLKARADEQDVAWLLVLDSLIFSAEAEVRWLDHCEARLARRPAAGAQAAPVAATQAVRSRR